MNDVQAQLKKQDETISLLRSLLEQVKAERAQGSNHQTVHLEGGNHMLGSMAIGAALGAVIVLSGWVGNSLSAKDSDIRELRTELNVTKDYQTAAYAAAPQLPKPPHMESEESTLKSEQAP